MPGVAYATVVSAAKAGATPITAESEAEKPTRRPAAARRTLPQRPSRLPTAEAIEVEARRPRTTREQSPRPPGRRGRRGRDAAPAKKKTRRGSRGGKRRKKAPTIHVPGDAGRAPNGDPGAAPDRPPRRRARDRARGGARPRPSQPENAAEAASPDGDGAAPRSGRRGAAHAEAGTGARSPQRRLPPKPATAARIPPARGHLPAFRTSWPIRDHQPRRQAVRRQRRRAPARRPPGPGRRQDVPARRSLPRRRRRRRAGAEGVGHRQGRRPRARPEDADRQVQAEVPATSGTRASARRSRGSRSPASAARRAPRPRRRNPPPSRGRSPPRRRRASRRTTRR